MCPCETCTSKTHHEKLVWHGRGAVLCLLTGNSSLSHFETWESQLHRAVIQGIFWKATIGLWEWHTISVSCVSAQDEKEDTRTRHPNNSGRWKGLKHLHLVCVLACRSANHSFQKNPLRCSCNPHLKTAKEGLSRARLRWREFSAYWKMWFASGKLQLLSPEQNLGAAEWKPFQTGRTSHTTEILIFVKSFNEQQKAKEWDKVGAPDHSP